MSQKIEIHTRSGSSYHVSKRRAYEMRNQGRAVFIGTDFRSMMEIRGEPKRFDQAWQIRPSGGIPVWQFCP